MNRPSALLLALPALLAAASCSSLSNAFAKKDKSGPGSVNDLLTHVEKIQAESVRSKDAAREAVNTLRSILGDEFTGAPKTAHADLRRAIARSTEQAETFAGCIGPMKQSADRVFIGWTQDLESFSNSKMRQQSQARMEETRERFEEIVSAAVAAQITFDALNGELNDHALFLEHDFNAASVGMLAGEVDSLRERARELDRRLDACAESAKTYVGTVALHPRVAEETTASPVRAKPTARPTGSKSTKAKRAASAKPAPDADGDAAGAPADAPSYETPGPYGTKAPAPKG